MSHETYILAGDLRVATVIPVYSSDVGDVGESAKGVVLRRDEVGSFTEPRELPVERHEGRCFIEAISAPGNQSTYPYMLMREVGWIDRSTGEFKSVAPGELIGATKWDLMTFDQRPGGYFVTMRRDDGKSVALLGPFIRHIDALLRIQAAKNYVVDTVEGATWFHYGTSRVDGSMPSAPAGKLNGLLLSNDEKGRLLSPVAPDANYVKIYGTMSASMRDAYDNLVSLGVNKHFFTPKGAREYADEAMRGNLSTHQIEHGSTDLLQAAEVLRGEFLKMDAVVKGLVNSLSAQIAKMNESISDPDFHHKPLPDYLMLEASLDGLVVKSKDSRATCSVLIEQVGARDGEPEYVATQLLNGQVSSSKSRACTLVDAVCWASNVLHDHGDTWKPERQGHEAPAFRFKG